MERGRGSSGQDMLLRRQGTGSACDDAFDAKCVVCLLLGSGMCVKCSRRTLPRQSHWIDAVSRRCRMANSVMWLL
jgi:hypothetical protein